MIPGSVQREGGGGAFHVEPEKKWRIVDREKMFPAYNLYRKVGGDND